MCIWGLKKEKLSSPSGKQQRFWKPCVGSEELSSPESFSFLDMSPFPSARRCLYPLWWPGVTWHCSAFFSDSSKAALGWQMPQWALRTDWCQLGDASQNPFILIPCPSRHDLLLQPASVDSDPRKTPFFEVLSTLFCMLRCSLFNISYHVPHYRIL